MAVREKGETGRKIGDNDRKTDGGENEKERKNLGAKLERKKKSYKNTQ
jgi:hypothetical protein